MLKSATQLFSVIAILEMILQFKIVLFLQSAILETKIKSKMMSLNTKHKYEIILIYFNSELYFQI